MQNARDMKLQENRNLKSRNQKELSNVDVLPSCSSNSMQRRELLRQRQNINVSKSQHNKNAQLSSWHSLPNESREMLSSCRSSGAKPKISRNTKPEQNKSFNASASLKCNEKGRNAKLSLLDLERVCSSKSNTRERTNDFAKPKRNEGYHISWSIPPIQISKKNRAETVANNFSHPHTKSLSYNSMSSWASDFDLEKLKYLRSCSLDEYDKLLKVKDREIAHASNDDVKEILKSHFTLLDKKKNAYLAETNNIIKRLAESPDQLNSLLQQFYRSTDALNERRWLSAYREDILEALNSSQVLIVTGEMGYGKSTLLPLYASEICSERGIIVSCQLYNISVTTLTKRLARLRGVSVGKDVGYHLRYDSVVSTDIRITNKLLFATNHFLLKEMLDHPLLSKYSCLILDDCHSRTLETGVLLMKVKEILQHRPHFKLILVCSDIEQARNSSIVKDFEKFFSVEKVYTITLPRITFPVSIYWNNLRNPYYYIEKAVELVKSIHRRNKNGNVVVFVTTLERVQGAITQLEEELKGEVVCFRLYSKTGADEIDQIFSTDPRRKIIFCTECAESLNLPNVSFVIDSGRVKEKIYKADKGQSIISESLISRERAEIRRKLTGHVQGGGYYQLYTEKTFHDMSETPPIMSKMNPGNLVLTLLHYNVPVSSDVDFICHLEKEMLREGILILEKCGAVKGGALTGIGRAMAVLPFELKFSKLVALGMENGFSFETVMIAILSSLNVPIFNTRDQLKDVGKHCFFHADGDYFAIFKVYSQWMKQNYSETWCVANGINHSSLMLLHQKLVATFATLNIKDCRMQTIISHGKLIEFICNCFSDNLCIYTGHFRLGYKSLKTGNILHVHHSSTFCYKTDHPPQYIVYDYHVEHSGIGFMINVTPVPSYMVETMLESCHAMRESKLDNRRMDVVVIEPVGEIVIKSGILGKEGKKRKDLEEKIKADIGCDIMIIDPNVESGRIEIYTYPEHLQYAKNCVLKHIEVYLEKLKCQEEEVTMPAGNVQIKISWGQGAMIKNVLGVANKNSGSENVSSEQESMCSVIRNYSIMLTWRRRLCKGNGYVTLYCRSDFEKASLLLSSGGLKVCGKNVKVCVSRKDPNQFYVEDLLPQTSNQDLKEAVEKHIMFKVKDATTVYIPPFSTSQEEVEIIRENLLLQFIRYLQYGELSVHVETPNSTDVSMKAYLNFDHFNDVAVVLSAIDRDGINTFQGIPLNCKEVYRTTVVCFPQHYNAVEKAVENGLVKYKGFNQKSKDTNEFKFTKSLVNGKTQLKLLSNNYDVMQQIEKLIIDSLEGEKLHGFSVNQLRKLFSYSGQQWLKQAEKMVGCYVLQNYRQKTLSVCGTRENKQLIKSKVDEYLDNVENEIVSIISMGEKGFNRQVIKQLITKYGIGLEKFVVASNLISVDFNVQHCQLTLYGAPDSIRKAEQILQSLSSKSPLPSDKNEVVCPVCFEPPEISSYRLQYCGHHYCFNCLRLLMAERQLPLKCINEGCEKELVIEDVLNILEGNEEETQRLLHQCLNIYVEKNSEHVKPCPTPNCNMIYDLRSLPSDNSGLWTCPACRKVICTKCNIEEHHGKSCDFARNEKHNVDYSLKVWMENNLEMRKHCPNCKAPIEKNGGCNHMECRKCQGHFCWLCTQAFVDGNSVYNHLPFCSRNQRPYV